MQLEEPRGLGSVNLRVLLVEDSQDDAEVMVEELRDGGYCVEYTRVDTEHALRAALAQRHDWQLVLCDFALPSFNAVHALQLMRELNIDLPFIVVSAAVGEETAIELMRQGAHDFLLKGNLSRLVPAVARELRDVEVRTERAELREQLLLSDRLVQMGTLAAGVAHEINNPLAYIMGNLEFTLRELSSAACTHSVPRAVREALSTALEGAQRIRATAEDLRIFSRVGDRQPHPVDLKRVLESAIGMAGTQIRYRAQLVKEFEEVPPIASNENRLGQVFLNLLINAAQAIPEGHTAEHEIRVRLRCVEHRIEVEISDTGAGIPERVQQRLFQPFVTTKPKEEGTGLGLSICRRIVQEYGGEISARANADRGTTFQVRLPVDQPVPASTKTPGHTRGARGRRRLLVIDDEREIVEMIRRRFSAEHEVLGVSSSHAALVLLAQDPAFDVILCDLMLPSMNGMQLHAELQRTQPALASRMIFMTGGAFTPAARQFLCQVSNLSLTKPFDMDSLGRAVRRTLSRVAGLPEPLGAAS